MPLVLSVEMTGVGFSPAEAERQTGLFFVRKTEPGDLMTRGRYKGQASPYGVASLEASEDRPDEGTLSRLLDAVLPHEDTLRAAGVEEMTVWVGYLWRDQCNLSFEPEDLTRVAALGAPLCISCYEDSEGPNE